MQWFAFGLDQPHRRKKTLEAWYGVHKDRQKDIPATEAQEITLALLDPVLSKADDTRNQEKDDERPQTVDDFFAEHPKNSVWFVDLQSSTAGDDWGWINKFVSLLPHRDKRHPKHLLIVDAVEGLETLVGDRDAYGSRRSRRSRVAQLIRNANRKGTHVVFIVEESRTNTRLPEQFVTDLVIHVRQHRDGDYSQRTIEIEKCRAIPHVRGEHELSIRTGGGACTGAEYHLDNPQIIWTPANKDSKRATCLSHVHITRSMHRRNREVREDAVDVPSNKGKPTFGLDELDKCFKGDSSLAGSVTLVLGDAGTHKTSLTRRFLSGAFLDNEWEKVRDSIDLGVAVLISSRLIDKKTLITNMISHWDMITDDDKEKAAALIEDRVLCQRLGSRRLSSAPLGEIVATYIHHAQQLLLGEAFITDVEKVEMIGKRRSKGHRIRVVLEDWSALLSSHGALQSDPMLLQSIITLLRREEVNALIVSTQPAQPSIRVQNTTSLPDLRSVDETQILTWPVSFYGQRRTAITVASGSQEPDGPSIYELLPKSLPPAHEGLQVDPHFDIYRDVDAGRPSRVPLVVRLYSGSHPSENVHAESLRFARLLRDSLSQVFASDEPQHEVLQFGDFDHYDRFFAFATELNSARLDYSLVMQIDDFWSGEHQSLADLEAFWNEDPVVRENLAARDSLLRSNREQYIRHSDIGPPVRQQEVPTNIFLESCRGRPRNDPLYDKPEKEEKTVTLPIPRITSRGEKAAEFEKSLYGTQKNRSNFFVQSRRSDRIPYLWDFGMLLADRELWRRHADESVPVLVHPDTQLTIRDVWDSLCLERSRLETCSVIWLARRLSSPPVDWPTFLAACRIIADRERIAPFDVDLSTAETLTCLVLEAWASIQDQLAAELDNKHFWPLRSENGGKQSDWTLKRLVTAFPHSLYLALAHLTATCMHLQSKHREVTRSHVSERSAASRQWYQTAAAITRKRNPDGVTLLQLPGSWATRGDWALAVAAGSRSKRLAHLALDLLSTRRMNLLRLQDGFGLPVRDILPDSQIGELPSAIYAEDFENKNVTAISYGEICYLGEQEEKNFHWLWRSSILHFDRDSFYFRRWIARMFEEHDWLPSDFLTNSTVATNAMKECRRVEELQNQPSRLRQVTEISQFNKEKIGQEFTTVFGRKLRILAASLRCL